MRPQEPYPNDGGDAGPQGSATEHHLEQQLDGDQMEDLLPEGPPDEPVAVEDYGMTAREQRSGEPLDERLAREEPEVSVDPLRPRDADEPWDGYVELRVSAGRLVAEDEGAHSDTEADEVARDIGGDDGRFGAEEQAVRIEPEA
jgi:hypothetical protein